MSAQALMGFDEVLAASDVQYDEVTAWGRKVAIMSITAGEVLDWVQAKESGDAEAKKGAGLLLLARSMVNKEKQRLCDTPEKEQQMVAAFKLKDSRNVNVLVTAVLKMNGIIDDDDKKKPAASAADAKND